MVANEENLISLSKSKNRAEIASWDKKERTLDGPGEDSG